MMNLKNKLRSLLIKLLETAHRQRRVVLALSCLVVFMTTYVLILPAFTLEKDKAIEMGGIDVETEEAVEAEIEAADPLVFEGEDYNIAVTDKDSVLPQGTEVKVEEITQKDNKKEYKSYYKDALAAVQDEKGGESVADFEFAKFYDISLMADGEEISEPDAAVNVSIEYGEDLRKALNVADTDRVRIVHFANDDETGETVAEVLDPEKSQLAVETEGKTLTCAAFDAGSFSVYAVVYTVDFHYDVDGETYDYSIPGGSTVTLSSLVDKLGIAKSAAKNGTVGDDFDAAAFVEGVDTVKFSDPALVTVTLADKDTTINGTKVKAGDWALTSNKAFTSTEKLTITMKNGEKFEVKVTDAQSQDSPYKLIYEWEEGYPSWHCEATIIIRYYDSNGNDITDKVSGSNTRRIEKDDIVALSGYAKDIDGYTFTKIEFNNGTPVGQGEEVDKLEAFANTYGNNREVRFTLNGNQVAGEPVTHNSLVEVRVVYDADDPNPGGGGGSIQPPDFDDLPKAKGSKTLTPNDDGTYTLTLSMEVPKLETQKSNKANVVIIYDSSNSMHEPVPGNTWKRDDEHGTYTLYNGKYYQLTSFGTDVRKTFSFIDENGVTHSLGADRKNDGVFCGPKYSPSKTRMDIAQDAVKYLAKQLLANNTINEPNKVEIAFVEFASDIQQVQQPTTSLSDINGWVESCHTAVEQTQNGGDLRGGTNWDAALRVASGKPYEGHENVVSFGDNDQKYIIFVSDGNPTARTTPDGLTWGDPADSNAEYDDGTRIGASGLFGGVTPGVYGNGLTDPRNHNFNCAQTQATTIVNVDKTLLYNVGIYGDADRMQELAHTGYFEGTDEESMKNAFNAIVGSISCKMGYTNLQILDGITSMTSTTLVHGNPKDFTYKVTKKDEDGNEIDITDQVLKEPFKKAVYHSGDDPETDATESGYVTWELGTDKLLLEGGTYSVSFIVWPNQDAYDLVSDLNNVLRTWEELSVLEKSQVVGSGDGTQAPFSLRTNTYQKIQYSTARAVTDSQGDTTVTPGDPGEADLETPDPMPLTDSKVKVQKEWEHDLDSDQYNDFVEEHKDDNPPYAIDLTLNKEGSTYIRGIQVGIPDPVKDIWPENQQKSQEAGGGTWPDIDGQGTVWHHISAGLMVSHESANNSGLRVIDDNGDPIYKTANYNGTTYYILEDGHDYTISENLDDHHFEQEEKVWHPMVVDGELKNVTFENLSSDNPTVKDIEDGKTFTLKNQLKGGIRIYKDVYDKTGTTEINSSDRSKFPITIALTAADGGAYNASSDVGGYRIYYENSNRPEGEKDYGEEGTAEYVKNKRINRSVRYDITNGTFNVEVYAGEFIHVANVDRGTHYTITEAGCPSGYDNFALIYDPTNTIVESNSEHNVYVKNKKLQPSGSLKIDKLVKIGDTQASEMSDSRKDLADGTYTFNVFKDSACTQPATKNSGDEVGNVTVTILGGESTGAAEVSDLAPGDYYVKEVSGTNTNVQLDTTVYKVTVVDGESGASVSAGATATATNTLPVGSLKVTKTIASTTGETLPEGTYTYPVVIKIHVNDKDYYVQNTDGVLGEEPPATSLSVTSGGELSIANLPYGAYAVVETNPGNVVIPDYSYTEEDDSVAAADVTVAAQTGTAALKNYYMKGAHWTPEVVKHLNGQPYAGTEFSFTLEQIRGKQNTSYSDTATTDAETGKATFNQIDYANSSITGHDGIFVYSITENTSGALANVTYDTRTIYAKVEVTKNQGKLTASSGYYSDEECTQPIEGEPVFDNTETAALSVTKTVTGEYTPQNSETYPITIMKGNQYLNYTGSLVDTDPGLTIGAGSTLTFTNIPAGTYYVREGGVNGGEYSVTTTYKVNNGDPGTGAAEATLGRGSETSVEIINHYSAKSGEINIVKIDETTRTGETKSLENATFVLYRLTTPSGSSESSFTVYPNETDSVKKSDEHGWLFYGDLPSGRYKILETDPPEGYVLEDDLEIYFTVDGQNVTWTNSEGQAIASQDMVSYESDDNQFIVGNEPGTALPHTGGIGTTVFYVLGSMLVFGCGVMLVARRRMRDGSGQAE